MYRKKHTHTYIWVNYTQPFKTSTVGLRNPTFKRSVFKIELHTTEILT